MAVVVDFRLEGSADRFVWTGDRVSGVCAALCVCRRANVVENGLFPGQKMSTERHNIMAKKREEHDQKGQDATALRKMAIVACLDSVMNMKIPEVEVVSLLFCLAVPTTFAASTQTTETTQP